MRVHFIGRAFDYQTLRAIAYTTFGGAEAGEVLATAERIECPTLILAGEDDHFVPLEMAGEFDALVSGPTTL